jgi:acetyltransferase-like isoleucine patch superfamily enzyme
MAESVAAKPSLVRTIVRRAALRLRARPSAPALSVADAETEFGRNIASGVLVMGHHTIGFPKVHTFVGDPSRVFVGSFCSLAEGTEFIPGGLHRVDWISTFPLRWIFRLPGALEDGHPATKGDITVGNDVWLGIGVTVLSGVTIGDGAVVGSRAVVASDVRPYAVVVGNPAREIARRFDDEQVDALLRIRWWDWPLEVILNNVSIICSSDVDALIAVADGQNDD